MGLQFCENCETYEGKTEEIELTDLDGYPWYKLVCGECGASDLITVPEHDDHDTER